MARDDAPPFGRGETYYGINPSPAIDTNNLFASLQGQVRVFEDLDYSKTGAKPARTNRKVTCIILRNTSGIALLPKRLVTAVVGDPGKTDGYATTTAQPVVAVVDEWLPAAGVPNNDLYWGVIQGPTVVLTDLAGGANNNIPLDTILVSLTAATSQATTAGRVAPLDQTGATTVLSNNIMNALGRALTAATTSQTNTGILMAMFARYW